MTDQPERVRMEGVDWPNVLPWVCLFRSFRAAISPRRLLLALVLVILAYLGARAIDAVRGAVVYPGEIAVSASLVGGEYEQWRQRQESLTPDQVETTGVLEAALQFKLEALGRLARAAVALNFGLEELAGPSAGRTRPGDTVAAAGVDLFVTLPRWLVRTHPWLLLVYLIFMLALWSVFGGSIARLAALDAAEAQADRRSGPDSSAPRMAPATGAGGGLTESVRFALTRFSRFFVTPVFPWIFAGIMAALLMAGGLVLFNLPVLDILGGLFFFVALAVGLAITMLLLLSVAGGALFYPAIAVEDADVFDAVSRALGYVLARPWRWAFYTLVAVVYGAITYLFVGVVLFLAVAAAHCFLRAGVLVEVQGVNRLDLLLAAPEFGALVPDVGGSDLSISGKAAAGLAWLWVALTRGLLPAYGVSFFITASTWIYLLLRRAADGNELDDVYLGPPEPAPTVGADSAD